MKQTEILELTIEDIRERIADFEGIQRKQKLAHAVSHLENPLKIRANRKTIARLKTELRKRELNNK